MEIALNTKYGRCHEVFDLFMKFPRDQRSMAGLQGNLARSATRKALIIPPSERAARDLSMPKTRKSISAKSDIVRLIASMLVRMLYASVHDGTLVSAVLSRDSSLYFTIFIVAIAVNAYIVSFTFVLSSDFESRDFQCI